MLVAAMNPCRCGRASEPGFTCKRGANARCAADYQGRLSGPLIDRIDLHIEVPAVTAADLILPPPAEGSREVAERVARARAMQVARYAAVPDWFVALALAVFVGLSCAASVAGGAALAWTGRRLSRAARSRPRA